MITLTAFLATLLLGMPIVFVLVLASIVFMCETDVTVLLETMPLQMFNAVEINGLLAIPMYMLVGEIMNKGGITDRLMGLADALVGRFRGGMAYANLLTNMMASAILGSATAQISVMARTMVPAMVNRNYDKPLATAITVAGGMLGPIIPPSMILIIYSVVSYQSVAALFVAGILPGLLIATGFASVVFILGLIGNYPEKSTIKKRNVWPILLDGLLPLAIPVLIIVGVVSGAMTPTESGAAAALFAFIIGRFGYKRINVADLGGILKSVALNTTMIISLIGMATVLAWVLAFENIPDLLAASILSFSSSPWAFLLMLSLSIILLGTIIDGIGIMIVIVPILLPVAKSFGIDPIQFGIVTAISTIIGLVTPPVGPGLYVAMEAADIKMAPLVKAILPFFLSLLLSLLMIILIPEISTWLPKYFELY